MVLIEELNFTLEEFGLGKHCLRNTYFTPWTTGSATTALKVKIKTLSRLLNAPQGVAECSIQRESEELSKWAGPGSTQRPETSPAPLSRTQWVVPVEEPWP